jgi:hypothetical protein
MLKVPSKEIIDPGFKKLLYVRYADDWIIGLRGSRQDCVNLLGKIREFLRTDLKLNLSDDKTLITNVKNEFSIFLSTKIKRRDHGTFHRVKGYLVRNNKEIRLTAPIEKVTKKLSQNNFIDKNEPSPHFIWMSRSKDEIILLYNSMYRGIINYYRFAENFNELSSKVHYILRESCAKLLAAKLSLGNRAKVYAKFGKNLKGKDKHGFIKITLGLNPFAFNVKTDDVQLRIFAEGISKATLENLSCEKCDSRYRVEMHHVRMMKDINPKARFIDKLMAKKNRKQIPLCRECHVEFHKLTKNKSFKKN